MSDRVDAVRDFVLQCIRRTGPELGEMLQKSGVPPVDLIGVYSPGDFITITFADGETLFVSVRDESVMDELPPGSM